MATFRYSAHISHETFNAHDKEMFQWLVERFGQSALSIRSANHAYVGSILQKGMIDTNGDLDIEERWFWYGEKYYFRDENDYFEFKMRWG